VDIGLHFTIVSRESVERKITRVLRRKPLSNIFLSPLFLRLNKYSEWMNLPLKFELTEFYMSSQI
jgi:hypothetical protein